MTPLSYIFIASILAAIAIPVIWIGVSGELAAIRAGAVDLAITYARHDRLPADPARRPRAAGSGAYVAVFALGLRGDGRSPPLRTRGSPGATGGRCRAVVRARSPLFAVILIAAGTALIFDADIFPWVLGAETSVIFGFIYLGAAAYFLYGLPRPRWPNAQGQLVGFLAYDLVLIGPFLDRFGEASGGELTSLIIYTAFVVYSGALAVYYLFVAPQTKVKLT